MFTQSSDTAVNIGSSYPTPTGWSASVGNASDLDTEFNVQALCGRRPKLYAVVQSPTVPIPGGRQATAYAHCPARMLPVGGGAVIATFDPTVDINSSLPSGPTWRVDENNGMAADTGATPFTAVAVCARLKGYTVVTGPETLTGPFASTYVSVTCPSPAVPVGGGALSFSSDTLVSLNSSAPSGVSWIDWVDNATSASVFAQDVVVCAGT